MLKDQHRIRTRCQKLKPDQNGQIKLDGRLEQQLLESVALRGNREKLQPHIEYPDLPVANYRQEILEALQSHQVVIVAGETGSGKTTQLPKICLEAGYGIKGLIGHTQPRRLAARSVSSRIAEEMKSKIGDLVGFKIRFSDEVSENSLVKLMTDGILLAEIQEDRYLNQYEVLIIDEAHERSLNIDFILGYLKNLLKKRKDLKVIITSATIDPERFSKHFDNAPMISVEGRSYPVEVRYRPLLTEDNVQREQNQAILDAVNELSDDGRGDILVFLSGEREIRDTADFLVRAKLKHTDILPLYARLSASEQNRIFGTNSARRIVLATNVAETSLTVPGIRYVIDAGTARISRYSVRSKVQRLPIEAISQASANQRAGRCGRVANGICIRLYSEDDFNNRPEFTDPEILRTNLAAVILQLTGLRMGQIDDFPFVQPPESKHISAGIKLLEELNAVSVKRGLLNLTKVGLAMARLPVDPRYGRMVYAAQQLNCLNDIIIIVAGLSIQDPRERPKELQQKSDECHKQWQDEDSDFLSFLNLWQGFREQQKELSGNQLRKWCKEQFLNYLRMREWQDIVSQLKQSVVTLGWRVSQEQAEYDSIHKALLYGLLSHSGLLDNNREYLGARNNKFFLFPGSGLGKKTPKWVTAAEMVETSRLFARNVAKIQPAWLEEAGKHLCKYRYAEPFWSKKAGACKAAESVTLLGLPIVNSRSVMYSNIDPAHCRQLFISEGLVNGDTKLNYGFLQHNAELVADVEKMEDKIRRKDLLVDEEILSEFYQRIFPEDICTEAQFSKWWKTQSKSEQKKWHFDPSVVLKDEHYRVSDLDFPTSWSTGNTHLPLDYIFNPGAVDDGVSLLIPLALLNQIENVGFDWLVPGLREELGISLIKSLPKQLRRNFVPAPDYAKAAVNDIEFELGTSFIQAFARKLTKMSGVVMEEKHWEGVSIPEHLQFNFKLQDKGKVIGQSRCLADLQHKFKGMVSKKLKQVAKPGIERKELTDWDFDDLPEKWTDSNSEYAIVAYPALQKDGQIVNLKLFDNQQLAQKEHDKGVGQLLLKQLPSPTKYLHEKLPNKSKLGLYFNPFGQIKRLIDDIISAVISKAITDFGDRITEKSQFNDLKTALAADLNELVLDAAILVEKGLTTAHAVSKKLKGNTPLNMIAAYGDVKAHLTELVYPGFVSDIGIEKLRDWNRYLAALEKRIEKLPIDPTRDRTQQLNVEKVVQRYQSCLAKVPKNQLVPQELLDVRWQIEELRVSLFAQQLGTNMPISSKRIENYLDKF